MAIAGSAGGARDQFEGWQRELGAWEKPEQYVEAAQPALEQGFPDEAQAFLEQDDATEAFGKGTAAERQQRLIAMAKQQSDEDQQSPAAKTKEAAAAPTGVALEKRGETLVSYGRYPGAITALTDGMKKGGLKSPDDAKLHLGVVDLGAGRIAVATAVLNSVSAADGTWDLAKMWLIRSAV